ncbi:hypothetical protein SAMN05421823_105142 [Catalinimonas alkaloidigena]|uniref:Uncharacterized protein n=1 Tax=Catalinimonas alkaloidigena TaxID=1075417 RepID=A0A1G9IXP3_9BACT|nr:hypothetical protein [Catalinimonas alkaloidigena]SDL30000.1 hypothetical protein SAMN05421823_105142 [Catalinimonas alkaloidigena]
MAALGLLSACNSDKEVFIEPLQLEKTEEKTVIQTNAIEQDWAGVDAHYDIKTSVVSFRTKNLAGKTVSATGVVYIPVTKDTLPLMFYQPSLLDNYAERPSTGQYAGNSREAIAFASAGYIVTVVDWAASPDLTPFFQADAAAQAGYDLLTAAFEMCDRQHIKTNNQIFMAGSEDGAYTMLALMRLIKTSYGHNSRFVVAGATTTAGFIDPAELMERVAQKDDVSSNELALCAALVIRYNQYYGWNRDLSHYFKQAYLDEVSALCTEQKFEGELFKTKMPKKASQLFTSEFLKGLEAGFEVKSNKGKGKGNSKDDESEFIAALQANSLKDFMPQTYMRMFQETSNRSISWEQIELFFRLVATGGIGHVRISLCTDRAQYISKSLEWLEPIRKH